MDQGEAASETAARDELLLRLRRAQEQLDEVQRIAGIGIWEIRVGQDYVHCSGEACSLFGAAAGDLQGPVEHFLGFIHPEDKERVLEAFLRAIQGRDRLDIEHRVLHPDGEVRHVRQRARLLGENGRQLLSGTVEDITDQTRARVALAKSEERFRSVASVTTDVIWEWVVESDYFWWSEGVRTLFGYAPNELAPGLAGWSMLLHPEEREEVLASMYAALAGPGNTWSSEYRFRHADGSFSHVLDRALVSRDASGKALCMVGAMTDITESKLEDARRRSSEQHIRYLASLLDKAKDAILVRDMENVILYWNKSAEYFYGWTQDEVLGKSVRELLYVDPQAFDQVNAEALAQGEWNGEVVQKRKDGRRMVVEARWTLVRDEEGKPKSVFSINTDITERKEAERKIHHLAFYDPMTRLPNRSFLHDRLQHALAASARSGQMGALMFLDLDNFKTLNDTLGHDKGDLLLKQVARRLEACVRESDTVARLGGDEFVVMLEQLGQTPADAVIHAKFAGEKILAAFEQAFPLDGYGHYSSPSIGVALFKGHEDSLEDILKRADLAMYRAKAAGRNTMRFYDPAMQEAIQRRAALEADLRKGAHEHEFLIYFQPQVEGHGRLTGAEALVRWRHPRRGMVAPNEFIPLAEETGLILQLGHWVLQNACAQLAEWGSRPATAGLSMAVNVSQRQFRHPDFILQVLEALAASGANPHRLKLELTESLLVQDLDLTIVKMEALKARGVSFSLDDFGTGYSSLAYLKRLPLDQLKIDRSFVRDVLIDPNDAAIARTVLALGQSLGLEVIAEGVETLGQRDFLAQNGCEAYQGFLFGPPLPREQLSAYVFEGA